MSSSADTPPTPLIVLVRPQMGENIGSAARAMLNFGLTGMRLVAPRDGWPNPKAKATAAGAGVVLDGVRVFDTVADAVADCHLVMATTARQRGLFLPVETPQTAAPLLHKAAGAGQRTAILFGAEKSGLHTDEVARADAIVTIPCNPEFSSLNLAQSVIVLAYELSRARETAPLFASPYDREAADRETVEGLIGHFSEILDRSGYFFPEEKRPTLERNVRTLVTNARFTAAEVRLFRGMIRQISHNLEGKKSGNSD